MILIALEILPMIESGAMLAARSVWKLVIANLYAAPGREADWSDMQDLLDELTGEPHEHLDQRIFYKMLKLFCATWTEAIVAILDETAECLPEEALMALTVMVEDFAENYWSADGEGLSSRDVQNICEPTTLC
eukprot:SAG11_NODE_1788_length_4257_cov_2.181097_3_plen_133_part_00